MIVIYFSFFYITNPDKYYKNIDIDMVKKILL